MSEMTMGTIKIVESPECAEGTMYLATQEFYDKLPSAAVLAATECPIGQLPGAVRNAIERLLETGGEKPVAVVHNKALR